MATNAFNKKGLPSVAYFSMEIGIRDDIKSYAGGLGILSGDTLKSAADEGFNMVGVTILYRNGYFKQVIDSEGIQQEEDETWDFRGLLEYTGITSSINLAEGKKIFFEILKYEIEGIDGHRVPIYFLNTDIEQNEQQFRYISFNLYTPFEETRLLQEIVLGIGGVQALKDLGYKTFDNYHLNESHAAFSILAVEDEIEDVSMIKNRIVFTTHTPAEHGHQKYSKEWLEKFLLEDHMERLSPFFEKDLLNLTKYCLANAKYSNAVAKKHGQVSSKMFPDFEIDYITNGIHTNSWISDSASELFDKMIPGWRQSPEIFRNVEAIPNEEIEVMHMINKKKLVEFVKKTTGKSMFEDIFTIGFGRRVDGYKRSDFILRDLERLKNIASQYRGIQLIFSGKAYFDYKDGEDIITRINSLAEDAFDHIDIVYIPDYGIEVSKKMVAGVDLWLNNPMKPLEASGTSGMKAALNGVPNFSTVDGWWVEGLIEGVTGWAIGVEDPNKLTEEEELNDLYHKLEKTILPLYYNNRSDWVDVQKSAISLNASFFNTSRMLKEYLLRGYTI